MYKRYAAVGLGLILLISACSTEPGQPTVAPPDGPTTTVDAPDTTQAPETTQAPPTDGTDTTTPADAESGSTPWWLLLLVLGAFVILIAAFVSRGSKKKIIVAPPPIGWKDHARQGYAEARWLYDALSEDLAIWRGNATFDSTAEVGATAGTQFAETWQQLDGRLGRASDSLYSLEAAAPDQMTAQAASAAVTSMRSLRNAVDARAESRMNYRTVQARSEGEQTELHDAREREVRASRNLADARSSYGTALTSLSTLL